MINGKIFFVGKNVKIRLININDYKDLKKWDPEGSSFNYFPNVAHFSFYIPLNILWKED